MEVFQLIVLRFWTKRYVGLVLCVSALIVAYMFANEHFGAFSTTVGLMYGAYVTGQSYTDSKDIENS